MIKDGLIESLERSREREKHLRQLLWRLTNATMFGGFTAGQQLRDEITAELPTPDEALQWMEEERTEYRKEA